MRLYIHIGSRKAGSTSIQGFLEDNKNILLENGYFIDDSCTFEDHWKLAAWAGYPHNEKYFTDVLKAFNSKALKEFNVKFAEEFDKKVEKAKASGKYHSMVISSEALCYQCNNDYSLERIHEILSRNFDSIHILFYYRDQVVMAKSAYAQYIHGPSVGKMSFFEFADQVQLKTEFDYAYQLNMWANYFGEKNISIGKIDDSSQGLKGKGLIVNFIRRLGWESGIDTFSFREGTLNRSSGFNNLIMIRWLNKLLSNNVICLDYNNLVLRGLRWIVKNLPVGGEFPSHFDDEINLRFALGNEEIIKRYSAN